MSKKITQEQSSEKILQLGQVFNPNTPVSEKDLFAGRLDQIDRVIDVIFQKGQHAIIFGERGVGKTSLANVLKSFFPPSQQSAFMSVRINCDQGDDFSSVWRKAFDEMGLVGSRQTVGFKSGSKSVSYDSSSIFPKNPISPEDVRRALLMVSGASNPIIILDEFDRLPVKSRKLFADLIKSLSDHSLSATIVLIGVGESVTDIIKEHESIARALVQVQMPRMEPKEISSIITNGLNRVGMTITPEALDIVGRLVKGLPHYAHLIGKNAAKDALQNLKLEVDVESLRNAIGKAINDTQHSIITNYHKAIGSSRKENLFSEVLLACAMANVNELGEFAAQDIREPIKKITGKPYNIPAYAKHLNEFSDEKRGKVLIKSGPPRRIKYKFSDPLMQPYVIMQGIQSGMYKIK